MRALTWQGQGKVSVEQVADPSIQEPTDAIVRVTSTAICGSDMHLYTVLAPFLTKGDILGHEFMGIVEEVGYASAFTFKYSPRPGTPAATMGDQVPEEVKDERLQRLQALVMEQSRRFNAAKVGTTTRILIDRVGRKSGQMIGKSPWLQSVHLMTAAQIGDIVEVEIVRADPNSLSGIETIRAAA